MVVQVTCNKLWCRACHVNSQIRLPCFLKKRARMALLLRCMHSSPPRIKLSPPSTSWKAWLDGYKSRHSSQLFSETPPF